MLVLTLLILAFFLYRKNKQAAASIVERFATRSGVLVVLTLAVMWPIRTCYHAEWAGNTKVIDQFCEDVSSYELLDTGPGIDICVDAFENAAKNKTLTDSLDLAIWALAAF